MSLLLPHALRSSILASIQKSTTFRSLEQIHALLLMSGLAGDRLLVAELAKSCAFSDHLPHAYEVILHVPSHHRTPFLLNTLISSLSGCSSRPRLSFSFYKHMVGRCGFFPDGYTFPLLLKSCAKFVGLGECRQVHGVAFKIGFFSDVFVQNALVHVYAVCCRFVDARAMFDDMPYRDVVSWTGLISGYVKGGFFGEAVYLFGRMDVKPNGATLVSMLVASGRLSDVSMGGRIHCVVLKRGEESSLIISNALLDMYVKCECLDEARRAFEELPCRDIVSWTSIITGLVQCGQAKEALEVFREMQNCKLEPDKVTLASVLSACASLGTLDLGRWVHDYINKKGIEWDVHIGTAIVDMYMKGGCMETALQVFCNMPYKNVLSWNALLRGIAMHGHGRLALDYYDQMVQTGFIPNEVTFLAVLSACSHSGLVEEGRQCFVSMTRVYNIKPKIEHYGCMVDVLSRAGLLEEAYDLIKAMPVEADVLMWGAMLNACNVHGNFEFSKQIQSYLTETKEWPDSGVYVLLSNIYAANNKWRDVTRTRGLMKEMGIKKEPGSSALELDGKTHEFSVGDCWDHPQREEICAILKKLYNQINLQDLNMTET